MNQKNFLYKERDEQKREEFVEQLEQNKSRGDKESQPVVYIDECGIQDHIKKEYGWGMKGEIIWDNKKSKPTEKLNLIAGLLNHEVMAPLTYKGYTDTHVFNVWLEQCLMPVLPPNCLIAMDNASFHKSEETREIIEKMGTRFSFYLRILLI